jgi:NADH-quinone oxidoreductase subunit C
LTVNWNRQNFSGDNLEQHSAIAALRREHGPALQEVDSSCGEVWAVTGPTEALDVLNFLRADPGLKYDFLSDLTAVHWPDRHGAEFDVVYQLYSIDKKSRFRVKVRLAEGQSTPSVSSIWKTADWLEREVYDMFGIVFDGHPDPRRIINPDDFEGHPLRKEFPLQGRVRW